MQEDIQNANRKMHRNTQDSNYNKVIITYNFFEKRMFFVILIGGANLFMGLLFETSVNVLRFMKFPLLRSITLREKYFFF